MLARLRYSQMSPSRSTRFKIQQQMVRCSLFGMSMKSRVLMQIDGRRTVI